MPTRSPLGTRRQYLAHRGPPIGCGGSVCGIRFTGLVLPSSGGGLIAGRAVVGESQQSLDEGVAALGVAADDQDGVVAGDAAECRGQVGLVERRGEELRGTRRGSQYDEVVGRLGADEQFVAEPGQPVLGSCRVDRGPRSAVAAFARDGVHEHAARVAHPDGIELDQVAGQGRLSDVQSRLVEQRCQLRLRSNRLVVEQFDDSLVPGRLRGRPRRSVAVMTRTSCLGEQPGQQRLLGVQPVLGLVPDDALRAVDDLGRDLLAPVRRQAVQDDCSRVGEGHRGRVDGVRDERRRTVAGLGLLAHRHPGVGDDDIGALDRVLRRGRYAARSRRCRLAISAALASDRPGRARSPSGEPIRTCMPASAPPSR